MIFAGAAFATGTGEAKDVLEGLAAYLQAKRSHYETLQRCRPPWPSSSTSPARPA